MKRGTTDHELANEEAARVILADVEKYGGPEAALVRWWAAHPDEEKRIVTCIEDVQDLA